MNDADKRLASTALDWYAHCCDRDAERIAQDTQCRLMAEYTHNAAVGALQTQADNARRIARELRG